MPANNKDILSAVVTEYLTRKDKNLAEVFKKKAHAGTLPKGAPKLEDVFIYFQNTSTKKIPEQKAESTDSSSDSESSEEEDKPKAKPAVTNGKVATTNSKKKAESSDKKGSSVEKVAPAKRAAAVAKPNWTRPKKFVAPQPSSSEESDSEEKWFDSSDDSSSEDEKPVRKKVFITVAKKPTKKVSSSEESSSEDEKPAPRVAGKPAFLAFKKSESSSEGDSSEDDKPKQVAKTSKADPVKKTQQKGKPTVTNGKAAATINKKNSGNSSEEESSSSEDEKPAPKNEFPSVAKNPTNKVSFSEESSSKHKKPAPKVVAKPAKKAESCSEKKSSEDGKSKPVAEVQTSKADPVKKIQKKAKPAFTNNKKNSESSIEEEISEEDEPSVAVAKRNWVIPKKVIAAKTSSSAKSVSMEEAPVVIGKPAAKPAVKKGDSSNDISSEDEKPKPKNEFPSVAKKPTKKISCGKESSSCNEKLATRVAAKPPISVTKNAESPSEEDSAKDNNLEPVAKMPKDVPAKIAQDSLSREKSSEDETPSKANAVPAVADNEVVTPNEKKTDESSSTEASSSKNRKSVTVTFVRKLFRK